MENKASKLGTAFAAAVLGVGLPAIASAQELPSDPQPADTTPTVDVDTDVTMSKDVAPVTSALDNLNEGTQTLANLSTISSADIALIPLGDMNMSAEQRYTLAQNMDASAEASLQRTLDAVTVQDVRGIGDESHSLADHLRMIGVDPANVVAVSVDDNGIVSVYYQ